MKQEGIHSLTKFKNRWQFLLLVESLCYALGAAVLVYLLSANGIFSLGVLLLVLVISALVIKPWKPDLRAASRFLDAELDALEYSTGLLLKPSQELSNLGQLQQIKVDQEVEKAIKGVAPPNRARKASLIGLAFIVLGIMGNQFNVLDYFMSPASGNSQQNSIEFFAQDSIKTNLIPPKIVNQSVGVTYPAYINKKAYSSDKMNIKAVEGSRVSWQLQFDTAVDSVFLQSIGTDYAMTFKNDLYTSTTVLKYSGFYNFKFIDLQGNAYTSDLYSIEVTPDERPEVEITSIDKYTSLDFDPANAISFSSQITDDYGIANANIIATVSKGSGESVKFREEQLRFDDPVVKGAKSLTLSKTIRLNQLKMEPGDELYFYVEASDLKTPTANIARSETYFVLIKDTVSYAYGVEGNLGVDRMPDYFRSQRQLIIDTEKLIKKRGKIAAKDFKFESNELGFDQKALRLKYGAFMGEESEMDAGGEFVEEDPAEQEEHDPDNPLSEFMHDHDSDNEHNLVVDKSDNEDSNDPLDDFLHDHDNSEKATLFTESLRAKLRKALNEMWDAELYLRLYEPEKSLPYQYRALKLIQDIKNSARIYVHRIGFDPPPIKEDKRLTGELDDVKSYRKSENLEAEESFPFMRKAILRLEVLKGASGAILEKDKLLFEQAGNELATLAIEFPGKYLNALQQLKWLAQGREDASLYYSDVQKALILAIPKPNETPSSKNIFRDEITELLIKELESND